MRTIVTLIVILLLVATVQAQIAYIQTDTPPQAGMLPVGTTFTMPVLNAQNRQWENHPARIDHYIDWKIENRSPEYYVSLTDWPGAFFFHNRQTIEQWVTLQMMVMGMLGQAGRG